MRNCFGINAIGQETYVEYMLGTCSGSGLFMYGTCSVRVFFQALYASSLSNMFTG